MRALRSHAPVFAALGDITRLRLVALLGDGQPRSIATLSHRSSITRQAMTKHLVVLRRAGLVQDSRRGRERLFALRPAPLNEALQALTLISRQWDDALSRLKAFVED